MFEFFGVIINMFAAAAPLVLSPEFAPEDRVNSRNEPQIASVAAVTAVTTGRMTFKSYTMTLVGIAPTNGDNDGYADTDETLDLALTLINKTGLNLTNIDIRLVTYDPTIACIGTYEVTVPSAAAGATFTAPPFRFTVAGSSVVNRANLDDLIEATFELRIHADQFEQLASPVGFTLPLDLNASGGSGTSAYIENFEIGGTNYGKFTLSTLDAGKNSLALSDGMRCQYQDPDGPNPNVGISAECFLGFAADPSAGINDWHIHDATLASGGLARAYTGSKTLHWGVHPVGIGTPRRDTVRFKQLDAVKSLAINLPLANAVPELVFAHQVSLVDNRGLSSLDPDEAADRAVVQVNVLTAGGQETPVWHKLYPYLNTYDRVGTDNYANCTFDPTDDGDNEDSYFEPAAPWRRLGPSSTCFTAPVFSCAGNTDYHVTATAGDICRAGDGPGLAGSIDVGTWVQPRFNLQQFAGRRIKIRFLATSIELGTGQTWDSSFFGRDDVVADDGWYIDDVRVNQALGLAMTVTADTKTVTPLPCALCSSITATLTATPDTTGAPGIPVTLDASGSAVDVCSTSPPLFQFWIDGNDNGIAGDAGDTLVRDFTEASVLEISPEDTNDYAVLVRCPSAPACDAADGSDTATALVSVSCSNEFPQRAFPQTIYVNKTDPTNSWAAVVQWAGADSVDAFRGQLVGPPVTPATTSLRDGGSFTHTFLQCLSSEFGDTNFVYTNNAPLPGSGWYYLVRAQAASAECPSVPPSYSTNAPSERPGRDAEIAAGPYTCP